MAYVNINIDISELYHELSDYEKRELADCVAEDESMQAKSSNHYSFSFEEFKESCEIIGEAYYRMSSEETDIINRLAAKYKL